MTNSFANVPIPTFPSHPLFFPLQKSMSTYVSDCYDSIAVFLCIHIILRFRAITNKRTIPALDKLVVLHQRKNSIHF